ncbi:unnamed protein product [Camellia sinensis]
MISLVSFFLLFSFCNIAAVSAAVFSNETDRQALFAFKDLITGDPVTSPFLSSWNDSLPLCEWRGVTCGRQHRRVVVLDLRSQGLDGSISPSIGNLTFLRSIYLQDNHLQGKIPQEVSHLFRLRQLILNNNTVQGEIPAYLSNCSDLRVIDFSLNDLVGKIPPLFGSLSKLTSLYLFANNLIGGIPPSLGNLTFLQQFSLGTNNLHGTIPDSIGHLTNLQFFGIGLNNISGTVPPSLYNISSLKDIYIPENHLTGSLPLDIGLTLPNLHVISVGGNHFTGPFPISLSNASRMRILDLSVSGLSGPVPVDLGRKMKDLWWINLGANSLGTGAESDLSFVDSLTNCTKLQRLALYENGFGGVLPKSIGNLSIQLRWFAVEDNQLVGTIPVGISSLVNLALLGLQFNHLSGPIPFEIGKLSNLHILGFSGNKFSGLIPTSFENLTQIFELYLAGNNLTGSIPSSIKNIKGLQVLDLSYNRFIGSIPKTIGVFYSLSSISLGNNSLNGLLPLELGSLKNLEELDVSENKFSGKIPTTLGECLKLERLYLEGNMLQGTIPTSFSLMKGIVDLDLSRNNLSGQIPIGLERLPYLENFNLSFNDLEGEVPSQGVFINSSGISLVGNAKLCGGIPRLHLPACPSQKSMKNRNPHGLKIIVTIASVGLCMILTLLLIVLYCKRKQKKKSPTESCEGDRFLRVSYGELFKATEGFSSSNLIGAGSFSTVYKGVLPPQEKIVAVKVLDIERLGASKSFFAECEALRKTRHRNLLKIITACSSVNFEGNDFKALVFEYMPNGSLEQWLHPSENAASQERNLNLTKRLKIAIDVATALEYLHNDCETPIVHCDLKPCNVLLDEDMIAHVGDFGLARFLTINTNHIGGETSSIAIKGSIGYVAPEYGVGAHVSTQGDIYSYGILLLEMVTGKKPTNEMFINGLSLHNFCKMALPERMVEIVDSRIILEQPNDTINTNKMIECLSSVVKIGVACSVESPGERMNINDVVVELNAIIELFLGTGIHDEKRVKMRLAGERTSQLRH